MTPDELSLASIDGVGVPQESRVLCSASMPHQQQMTSRAQRCGGQFKATLRPDPVKRLHRHKRVERFNRSE
jgi:hypothetical protein